MTPSKQESASLRIRLFGPLDVQVDGQPLPRLRSRKGYWLLALLALRQGREVTRDWLAGTLWPDGSEPEALHSLRISLADLRQALGAQAQRLNASSKRVLCLDLADAEVDVLGFDSAIARGDPVSLEQAAALYRGPLLEDCTEDWAVQERLARELVYLQALQTLAAQAVDAGDSARAVQRLRQVIAIDPLRE